MVAAAYFVVAVVAIGTLATPPAGCAGEEDTCRADAEDSAALLQHRTLTVGEATLRRESGQRNGTNDSTYERMLHTAEAVMKDRIAAATREAEDDLHRREREVMGPERMAAAGRGIKRSSATPLQLSATPPGLIPTPPPGITRARTLYGWCACGTGLRSVTFWPKGYWGWVWGARTVQVGSAIWVKWSVPVKTVQWTCDGMWSWEETTVDLQAGQYLSLQLTASNRDNFLGPIGFCHGRATGLVKYNTWQKTAYTTSVPFTTGTGGYFCFKIPALLHTAKGTLIAFAEGRKGSCSDFASTELLYRRSTDGGRTWGSLQVLVKVSERERQTTGFCGMPLVLGNVVPVQLSKESAHHPGRILAPYKRNNFKTWLIHSDDDGVTWTGDRELVNMTVIDPGVSYADAKPDCERGMDYFGHPIDDVDSITAHDLARFAAQLCYHPLSPYDRPNFDAKLTGGWQFVGIGPSKSLQLRSGRVLVPGYHGYVRGLESHGVLPASQLYSSVALGHTLITDDGGDTWRMSDDWGEGDGANENEMVELHDGSVLTNSRSLSTGTPQFRLQARSFDQGESFSPTKFTPEIQSPFNGAYGSTLSDGDRTVYHASPDPLPAQSYLQIALDALNCNINGTGRTRLSVWKSTTAGYTYSDKVLLDAGASAQNSFQWMGKTPVLLYEQSDPDPMFTVEAIVARKAVEDLTVQLPHRFVFRTVDI